MYIDTHAHLTDGAFDDDRQELINGLAAGGIGKIIEISCDTKEVPQIKAARMGNTTWRS